MAPICLQTLIRSKRRTFSEAEIGCDEKYHSLLLSFPGLMPILFSLRDSPTYPRTIGTNGYRFHDSTIKTFIEKLGQCKSPEEKEKAIADVKANTDRLNEVNAILITHIVIS